MWRGSGPSTKPCCVVPTTSHNNDPCLLSRQPVSLSSQLRLPPYPPEYFRIFFLANCSCVPSTMMMMMLRHGALLRGAHALLVCVCVCECVCVCVTLSLCDALASSLRFFTSARASLSRSLTHADALAHRHTLSLTHRHRHTHSLMVWCVWWQALATRTRRWLCSPAPTPLPVLSLSQPSLSQPSLSQPSLSLPPLLPLLLLLPRCVTRCASRGGGDWRRQRPAARDGPARGAGGRRPHAVPHVRHRVRDITPDHT